MQLTDKHIEVIREFITSNNQQESYNKILGTGNPRSTAAMATRFFKRPEVKRMIRALKDQRNRAIMEATEETYKKIYAEQIASDLELDMFHTAVVRGLIEVEEVFAVRRRTVNEETKKLEETVVFKRVKRLPTIKEKQVSASELYKRRGSYKQAMRNIPDQDDQEAAARANGATDQIERVIILSNGNKLSMYK